MICISPKLLVLAIFVVAQATEVSAPQEPVKISTLVPATLALLQDEAAVRTTKLDRPDCFVTTNHTSALSVLLQILPDDDAVACVVAQVVGVQVAVMLLPRFVVNAPTAGGVAKQLSFHGVEGVQSM